MSLNFTARQHNRLTALIDFIIIGILGSALYLIAVQTEAHLIINKWAEGRRFLGLELNKVFVVFAFLGIAFSVFSLRRWNELNIELARRIQTEKMLLESEENFRNLAEKSLAGIYLVQDEKFKYVNPVLAEIFGYAVEELIDKKQTVDLVLPEDLPVVRENVRRRESGEIQSIHYDFRGRKKNGEIIYVDVYGSKTLYQGRPAVIGTLLDITERKHTEERIMRQSREIELRNGKLSTLYKISSAIGRTIDMNDLFSNILNTISEIDILKVERKGGILLIDGDRMNLVSHLGHPKSFLNIHKNMTVNDCLCGLAARTGEIIISKNSQTDCRHTIAYPEMTPHGHIIMPLKAVDKIMGYICTCRLILI